MVGGNTDLLIGGLIAAATLFISNYFLGEIFYRSKAISKLIQGEPLMLIYEGKPILDHLKKAKISNDELEAAIREHGVANISEVDLAVLERDGNISVLSNNYKNKTTKKRKGNKIFSREIM
jgi:uncharacterized membrane protein YcaP (DUF421 family)